MHLDGHHEKDRIEYWYGRAGLATIASCRSHAYIGLVKMTGQKP